MYNWVKNIGFPQSGKQFNALDRPDYLDRDKKRKNTAGVESPLGDRNLYTDIRLTILSSKNNAVANIFMYEGFPISMSSIEYNQQETDTTYATCAVSFAYSWFDVQKA